MKSYVFQFDCSLLKRCRPTTSNVTKAGFDLFLKSHQAFTTLLVHTFLEEVSKIETNSYCIPIFLDSTTSFVYNYKPANFKEDFISALTVLVTAQDDPQRLKELTEGAKSILNDYKKELPKVLRQVKFN